MVGAYSAHVAQFLNIFNVERSQPGWALTHIYAQGDERAETLARTHGVELVSAISELETCVDAVLICDRDGTQHFHQAKRLLTAGRDVFINKPFTTDSYEAEVLGDAAQTHDAVCEGGSALRFGPRIQTIRDALTSPDLVVVTGPADAQSDYAGLHFYGSHHAEIATELLGNPHIQRPQFSLTWQGNRGKRSHVAVGIVGKTHVVLIFADPHRVESFRVEVHQDGQVLTGEPGPSKPLYLKQMSDFVAACAERREINRGKLVTPVAIMEQVVNQLPS